MADAPVDDSYQIRLIPSGWRIGPSLKRRAGWLIRSPL
ncbi:hypothetical protein LPLAFNJD_LOCUS4284 [Methylorubrum aminovorans]